MREFKFRGWDKKRKCMFQITEMNFRSNGMLSAVSPNQGEEFYPTKYEDENGVIVMQYTGLKDKNGVEVYEGDIVKSNRVNEIGIVEWNNDYFIYFVKTKIKGVVYTLEYFKKGYKLDIMRYILGDTELEVIGNIYENKELLKEN